MLMRGESFLLACFVSTIQDIILAMYELGFVRNGIAVSYSGSNSSPLVRDLFQSLLDVRFHFDLFGHDQISGAWVSIFFCCICLISFSMAHAVENVGSRMVG